MNNEEFFHHIATENTRYCYKQGHFTYKIDWRQI